MKLPRWTGSSRSSADACCGGAPAGVLTRASESAPGRESDVAREGIGAGGPVPVHPEVVAEDPQSLRWVMPPGTLSVRGEVTGVPAPLQECVAEGLIERIEAAADAVTIRLAAPHTWRESGARIRSALATALSEPGAWTASAGPVEGADAALAEAARLAIEGEAGQYVTSHGGHIELVGAHDGRVDVRLTGACGHCPAATATLRYRVETAIRRTYPDLIEVRQVS